jgi:hypothetical protein
LIVAIDIAPLVRWGAASAESRACLTRAGEIDDDLANAPIPLENDLEFLSLFKGYGAPRGDRPSTKRRHCQAGD